MTEKVERCPECGGYAMWNLDWYPEKEDGATGRIYKVECVHCGNRITAGTRKDAIDKWNLEAKLRQKIKAGDITVEEAEMEYQDYMHRAEVWSEW